MEELVNEILQINETTNGDCIFVGGVCSFINNKIKWDKINDIDFIVTKKKTLNKFNNLIKLKSNIMFGKNVGRFYKRNDGYSYDMFFRESPQYVESEINGIKIKHLSIDTQINGLKDIVKNIDNDELKISYQNKIEELCA